VAVEGPDLPAVRAEAELEPEQNADETGFVSDEARRVGRRCQGTSDLLAPNGPVKAPHDERRIVAVGDATGSEVSSVEKSRKLRLEGGL
jgi:hypothetical protein